MKRIIITAIGEDTSGLVNKITSIIKQNNGNIDNSKMIKIKDQFAMIIEFCLLSDLEKLKSKLNKIKKLKIFYQPVKDIDLPETISKTYLIKGADNQGIIDSISKFFYDKKINIIQIDSYIEMAPITGSPLFNMEITITYNQSKIDINLITDEVSKICNNLNLDIIKKN